MIIINSRSQYTFGVKEVTSKAVFTTRAVLSAVHSVNVGLSNVRILTGIN